MKKLIYLVLVLGCGSAQAALVTYRVTGTVESVSRTGTSPAGTFEVGDSLEAYVKFDTSTPDALPDDPNYGVYREIVTYATVTMGNASWEWNESPLNGTTTIGLENTQGDEFIDTVIREETGLRTFYMVLAFLNDPDQDHLTSDSFSLDPSGFETVYVDIFDFEYRDNSKSNYVWYVHADVGNISVNLVPIPPSPHPFGSSAPVFSV